MSDTYANPVTTLRGARVEVDGRRAARVAIGACLLTLLALSAAFFVVGADKNAQITELRQHGVPVEITVSKCLGLLGGSGSNAAGYACRGSYSLDGQRYSEAIPGNIIRPPGAEVKAVAVPSDPRLVSTASAVASERASFAVFILPTILLIVFALLAGTLTLKRRSAHADPVVDG